jgi:hypothetical protein
VTKVRLEAGEEVNDLRKFMNLIEKWLARVEILKKN